MAIVDNDVKSLLMNPSVYTRVKDDKKTKGSKRTEKTEFSRIFEEIRGKTAAELGPVKDLPVSDETINYLMDEVRSTGDSLRKRPLPDEIIRYKQAVRNFMHYVVKNCYNLDHETGIPKKFKFGYKGPRNTSEADRQITYTRIHVIDKKLEDLAAMLLTSQMQQLEIASRLEEIKGLLIDLMQ